MDPFNFLKELDGAVSGDGILKDLPYPLMGFLASGTTVPFATLTSASNPIIQIASATSIGLIAEVRLPRDFDTAKGSLRFVAVMSKTGSGTVTVTPTSTKRAYGTGSPSANIMQTTVQTLSTTLTEYSFLISGADIVPSVVPSQASSGPGTRLTVNPGDDVMVRLKVTTAASSRMQIYSAQWEYRRDIVAYDPTKR